MHLHVLLGVFFLCSAAALRATPLQEQENTLEDAVKTSPFAKNIQTSLSSPFGGSGTEQDLERAIQQEGSNEISIEAVVSRLMATRSSEQVQATGQKLIAMLEAQRKARAAEFESKAKLVLVKVPDAVRNAKRAVDLDVVLNELRTLQDAQSTSFDPSSQPLMNQITGTFEFVTRWQDYLSALNNGKAQEAQNSLRVILENRQIGAPSFFPRSEILARFSNENVGISKGAPIAPDDGAAQVDAILKKIEKADDVSDSFDQLSHIPNLKWDWSALIKLDKVRDDVLAGLPVTLDLKKAMNGGVFGDDISRIIAMELIQILPYYLDTHISNPPKANETVIGYLDRLADDASFKGNLALLQRVLSIKVALGNSEGDNSTIGIRQFLAGLSQDAAGQFEPAVVSYEGSLEQPDAFLPIRIVAARLEAIKAAHPADYEGGVTAFLNPARSMDPYGRPGMLPWVQAGQFGGFRGNQAAVLPIPMTISIPAHPADSPPPVTK
jgi:hypothetical protein